MNEKQAEHKQHKQHCAAPSESARQVAEQRQASLTKPAGALGRLEEIAISLAAMQNRAQPAVDRVQISIFAADHGVAAEGVSAFPQAVTAEMIKNFANGGAAICVAARALSAELEIINLGTVVDLGHLDGVISHKLGAGTANLAVAPAMTELQLSAALEIGRERVVAAKQRGIELFIGGEMGIANTTAATALLCALLDCPAQALTGPGTGLDAAGVAHKRRVIERALEIHVDQLDTPMNILRCVGGFEIAALVGAYAACAELQLPMLIDGFIASSAAVVAQHLYPGVEEWMLCAHCSAEPGHQQALAALGKQGILDVGMRLGEGSGAAVCVPLLRMACALHNQMATFAEAAVSNKVAVGDDAETNTNADANSNTKSEID